MKSITLYHNSQCSKSRAAFEILEKSGMPFSTVQYLETPPNEETLDHLLRMLKLAPDQIVRTGEDEYETLHLAAHPPANRSAWIKVLIENPILIERPIVTDGETAVVGRPPEKIEEWLKDRVKNG